MGGAIEVSQHGHCWSTNSNPTIDNCLGKTPLGIAGTGEFTSEVTGLSSGIIYHYRAYATNSSGTAYGEDKTFKTTMPLPPDAVSTGVASNITQLTFDVTGSINNLGVGITIDQHGHIWSSTEAEPTMDNIPSGNKTELGAVSQTGSFTSNIEVSQGDTYNVRSYIKIGTKYIYGSVIQVITTNK